MILPGAEDRSIVVFKVWPSLDYGTRTKLSFALIAAGLIVQVATMELVWGLVLIVLGNLLMLVSGYDNRVDFGKYDASAEWVRAEATRLDELKRMDRRIRRWDTSALDVTNALGVVVFVLVLLGLAALAVAFPGIPRILAVDAAVLLLPHWLTGFRSVLRTPKLLVKVDLIQHLFERMNAMVTEYKISLLTLLRGEETQVPKDLKFRVEPVSHPEGFLGLYGQVVLNEVQGKSYPYFYVVLVARRGFGLHSIYQSDSPPRGMTDEFKLQDEVEVLVVRQTTTKKSGYHTNDSVAESILFEGLRLVDQVAARQ